MQVQCCKPSSQQAGFWGVCVGGGGWPSTYFGQSTGIPPTSPGQHSGICLRGTAGKSQSVPIQGLRSQWAADEASDFTKKYSLYHSHRLPLDGNRCPEPRCSQLQWASFRNSWSTGPVSSRALALGGESMFESDGRHFQTEFSYIMLFIPVGLLKKNITN